MKEDGEKRRQQLCRLHKAIREKQQKRTRQTVALKQRKREKESRGEEESYSLHMPTEMWIEVFSHICVQHKLYSADESLETIKTCMLVCKQWNRILKTKFVGNPLFDEHNARLYVVDARGKVLQGSACISDVLITINERGIVEKIKKRKVTPISESLLQFARAYNALRCCGNVTFSS